MDKAGIVRGLGVRIREARKARGLSQTGLAQAVGVSRGAAGQWEAGIAAPDVAHLIGIATKTNFSLEWLATDRGPKQPPSAVEEANAPRSSISRHVPILSWVSAGRMVDAESQIPAEQAGTIVVAGLGRGDFFALRVQGDSMDRISPDGATIIVDRRDQRLIVGKAYVFAMRGETTYKIWHAEPPYLAPNSTNPAHQPIFVRRRKDFEVIGRVRRSILDL